MASARIGRTLRSAVFNVDLEARVPKGHPLRSIRLIVNEALGALNADFAALFTVMGRPPSTPEKLLRALLLQASTPSAPNAS